MKTSQINIELSEKNQALLSSRSYKDQYTELKNPALPESVRLELNVIYKALTGEDLPETDFTFLIRATGEGMFKRVYSPSVYRKEEDLVIKWGSKEIPLLVKNNTLTTEKSPKSAKFSFKTVSKEKFNMEFLSITVRDKDSIITMPFPIRFKDLKNPGSSELFEALLEDGDMKTLLSYVADVPNGENKDNVFRPKGFLIKEAALPLGDYQVMSYWEKPTEKYGTKRFMAVKVTEPFYATARVKENEQWLDKEVEVNEWAIVTANTNTSRTLAANPVIDLENPATLTVLSHGTTQSGFPYCKSRLVPVDFSQDENTISLNF